MKVISTNIGKKRQIQRKGKLIETGIFKYPVDEALFLNTEDVDHDEVIDRRYHGGADKACYLYGANQYEYWQQLYPNLEMPWGLFGENLSIENLRESEVTIGSIYRLGEAEVQITQPRQPCFKLEFRIPDPQIIQKFVLSGFSGVYVRVLKPGYVQTGDRMEPLEITSALSVQRVFELLYANEFHPDVLRAINDPHLAESCRRDLNKRWNKHLP